MDHFYPRDLRNEGNVTYLFLKMCFLCLKPQFCALIQPMLCSYMCQDNTQQAYLIGGLSATFTPEAPSNWTTYTGESYVSHNIETTHSIRLWLMCTTSVSTSTNQHNIFFFFYPHCAGEVTKYLLWLQSCSTCTNLCTTGIVSLNPLASMLKSRLTMSVFGIFFFSAQYQQ